MLKHRAAIAGMSLALAALCGCVTNQDEVAGAATWYVQSAPGVSDGGIGTAAQPFHSLARVQAAAGPGDEIIVIAALPGAAALDGGIVLQRGQTLRGVAVDEAPVLRNSDPGRQGGDVVILADDTLVTGLVISDAAGHAFVGRNVQGAVIRANQIQGANSAGLASVSTGATAGLGVPEFPKGAIAWVHDEQAEASAAIRPNVVAENEIQGFRSDGRLVRLGGAAVALHTSGRARAALKVTGNRVRDLGPGFPRSGILIDSQDESHIELEVQDTSVSNASDSSDGILIVAQHQSHVTAQIRRYRYEGGRAGQGVGNNGLEVVTYHGRNWLYAGPSLPEQHAASARVLMEESDITGTGGFGIAVWNIFGKPSADTVLDFGGGELGGRGANRITASGMELPVSMDVYVVHHDLNAGNNWWGRDRAGQAKAVEMNGEWQLGDMYSLVCPGQPGQIKALIDGTGVGAWGMFCQALRTDLCDGTDAKCCDRSTDPARCMMLPEPSTLITMPALQNDPRP